MKKYLFLCTAAIAALLAFASCGDDDEIEPLDPDNIEVKVGEAKFVESANQMVLTYTVTIANINVPVKTIADFQGDKCTRYITQYTFPNETMARQSCEENKASDDQLSGTVYSYSGKVYTEDETAYYKGRSKDEIRQELKMMQLVYNPR